MDALNLHQKLAAASKDVGGKLSADKRNREQGYDYISSDKIIAVCGQALAEQGVVVVPNIETHDIAVVPRGQDKVRYDASVRFLFTVSDGGNSINVGWIGCGSDYGVPDKALYKAITSGHKYFLKKLLNVGEGNEDGEHEAEPQPNRTFKPQVGNGNGNTAEPPPDDGWGDLPSASEERRAKPAAQPQAQAQPIGNPKCPQCGGPMWDNREKVAQAVREGRNPGPEWACKAGKYNPETRSTDGCDGKLWPGEWPPRQHPSEEQVNGLLKLVKEVYPNPGDKAAFRDWIAQMFGVNVETASSVRELLNKLTPAQAETAANELDATLRQMTAQV